MVDNITEIQLEILTLYLGNYLNWFHVREIANLIKKSHVTLLPHLKQLENNNILKFKIEGKNKKYFLNMDSSKIIEYLSIAEKLKTIRLLEKEIFINKLYSKIQNIALQGSLIVFGSYANNTQTKESDIDILYIGNLSEIQEKTIKNLEKLYNKHIHLVKMDEKSFNKSLNSELIQEIIKNHIILYNHDLFINKLRMFFNEKKI
jgi:predicted nucleotidyltransferase